MYYFCMTKVEYLTKQTHFYNNLKADIPLTKPLDPQVCIFRLTGSMVQKNRSLDPVIILLLGGPIESAIQ